jgi:hypothetical protein
MLLKTIAIIGALLLTAVVVIVILALRKPDEFRVSRTQQIAAPPERIYPLIADLRAWGPWSPYEAKDPGMARKFSGTASGPGAVYEWNGDKNVGAGRMEILDVVEPSEGGPAKIAIKLDMIEPFEGHNLVEFTMVPIRLANGGDGSIVTWTMRGPHVFPAKVVGLFVNMDEMIGKDFAAGLANLKSVTEK